MNKSNLDKFKNDLSELLHKSERLQIGFLKELGKIELIANKTEVFEKIKPLNFQRNYEIWYTEACQVIKQIIPERLNDFMLLYRNEKRKKTDFSTYTISDAILGLVISRGNETIVNSEAAFPKFQQQMDILKSAEKSFVSSLFDIKNIVQSDLFDSELGAARELQKKGFLRGAGAISGVVLEKHLKQVLENHKIIIRKKRPSISDLNNLLKKEGIIEVPNWRFIQHLGDIRNLCDHNKERDPKSDDIDDLINGVDKVIKIIF